MFFPPILKVLIEGQEFVSHRWNKNVGDIEIACVACGSQHIYELVTIVQHGFEQDDCLTIMHCETCHNSHHFHYQVDAAHGCWWLVF